MTIEKGSSYQKLIDTGAVLDRNGIDKIKENGGKIATVYLSAFDIGCQIELTAESIDSFCKATREQLGLEEVGDTYLGIFGLSENNPCFFPKEMLKNAKNKGGLWTLNEVKRTITGPGRKWLTKTLKYRQENQHLFR